jgi:hypothetical protein
LSLDQIGILPFPTRYDNESKNWSESIKFNYFYFLGTQNSEKAFPYILDIIDTMAIDTTVLKHDIAFLRYKEGLPTNDPFNEEWVYIGHSTSYMFFQMIINNKSKNVNVSYRDGETIIGTCNISIDEFKKGNRKKTIQSHFKTNIQ